MRAKRSYGFIAWILRAGQKSSRMGYINAGDELEAIDRVYEMGRKVWNRPVTEVQIMGENDGEVLATSKIGERVQQNLLNMGTPVGKAVNESLTPKALTDQSKEEPKKQAGMVPWSDDAWYPTQFGTYFTPPTFGRITSLK